MGTLPIHRVATTLPFFHYLQQQGVNIKHELQLAKLPVLAMHNPDSFIPSRNYWNLIANVATHKEFKEMGFIVGQQSADIATKPGLAKPMLPLESLHKALVQFCDTGSKQISRVELWLEPTDKYTHYLHYQTSFGPEHIAYSHFQWYGLMAAISTIRQYIGPQWTPRLIGLGSAKDPGLHAHKYFPETDFLTNQEHCFISISNRLLGDDLLQSQHHKVADPSPDFIDSLKRVLRSYLLDGVPSIDLAADISCLSKRTLQRKLDAKGLNYRNLISGLRYEIATELMQNNEHCITNISNQLGYSDPTHFSRAFRRKAGISPHEYLRQLS